MHAGTAKAQEFLNAKCPISQTKQSVKFLTEFFVLNDVEF